MKYLSIIFIYFFFQSGAFFAQPITEYWLQARMNGLVTLDNGNDVQFWGFGDNTPPNPGNKVFVPGPVLRFTEGDSAIVHFQNNSPEMHTIHFHGLDANQANDGVPHTSLEIGPNLTYDYKFKCTHAGTFIYHCHVLTPLHVAMGMYGLVIVDPSTGPGTLHSNTPAYQQEYAFLSSEFDLDWNNNPISPGPFNLFEANYFMLNGKSGAQLHDGDQDIVSNVGEKFALRLANIGYGKTTFSWPSSIDAQLILSDGRPVPTMPNVSEVSLYPGERYDLLMSGNIVMDSVLTATYYDLRNMNLIGTNTVPIKIGAVSITENSNNGFRIWPNPAADFFHIVNPLALPIEYHIINLEGKELQHGLLEPGNNKISCALGSGVYLVNIDQSSDFLKLILE